ncbi:uncharacterized protein LOC105438434 [Strongylocentrotus purpuratus]|uniref:Uncharacterized protein n=1 Tax=Strongylocentrotus purpuratus TaxID=7668 RepID=A0A7M7P478_STRPU|nr:uncharacterized protein LOC105438434 [Strongylocentrotus purpuratus]
MNEEPKVSKRITRKLERYLNRERVEQRFDTSGQGLTSTHPLVVKLELAYLIANEDEKRKDGEKQGAESSQDDSKKKGEKASHHGSMPRIRSLPQKKTRVQMSEIERLAKTAQSALKSIDADKISTVYRFRQQMIPYEVRHQGKVKQVSTSVHAMLNAEEAWRYRKENDERAKVKIYREQQKAKAKDKAAQEAKQRELSKLPPGIRMEIKRQQEKRNNNPVLEKLLEPDRCKASSPQYSVPMATEDNFADVEESLYEDDFEEEEDDDVVGSRVGSSSEKETGMTDEDGIIKNEDSGSGIMEDENEDEALIAAVTIANDAGSVSSFTPSTLTSVTSRPQSTKSAHQDQEVAMTYEDDSFESEGDEDEDQSVFMTDLNPGSAGGSRSSSRAPSRQHRQDDIGMVTEERSVSETSLKHDHPKQVKGHTGDNPGSGEVRLLANQLSRAVVRNAAEEEGVSYSSMSSIRSDRSKVASEDVGQAQGKEKNRHKTQEYTRTESVISLSDRVKRDLEKEKDA